MLGGKASSEDEALAMIKEAVASGKALDKLAAFIGSQGGNAEQVYHPELLKVSDKTVTVKADEDGYIDHIICDRVGVSCMMLGGGRASKEDVIDLSVGIKLIKKVGDEVKKGDDLAIVYYSKEDGLEDALDKLKSSYIISSVKPEKKPLIKNIIK